MSEKNFKKNFENNRILIYYTDRLDLMLLVFIEKNKIKSFNKCQI